MVLYCCVPECGNTNKNVQMHVFPKNELLYCLWITKIGRMDLNDMPKDRVRKYYRVCNIHFGPDTRYVGTRYKSEIKKDAVPSLFLHMNLEGVHSDLQPEEHAELLDEEISCATTLEEAMSGINLKRRFEERKEFWDYNKYRMFQFWSAKQTQDPVEYSDSNTSHLADRVRQLEQIISQVQSEMGKMIERDCVSHDNLLKVSQKLDYSLLDEEDKQNETFKCEKSSADTNMQTEFEFVESFEEKVKKLEQENQERCSKCSELENYVELLRNEYEKCEDYWQNKVDEERQMYEAEQRVNSEKLTELIYKMKEYEEQYASQEIAENRLPTIEETYDLEKQFTDLEQEFGDFKAYSENEIFKRDEEISILKDKLTELAMKQQQMAEAAIQVNFESEELRILNKMRNFPSYVVESTSRFSEEMLPPPAVTSPPPNLETSQSLTWEPTTESESSENSNSLPLNWNFTNNTKTEPSAPLSPNQEKEVKKTESNVNVAAPPPQPECNGGYQNFQKANGEKTILLPLSSFHNLNSRKNYLEQKVRHLQMCIKQQHHCNKQKLLQYWQQFMGERVDLRSKLIYLQEKLDQQVHISNEQREKLERTDQLLKDFYVQNNNLIANVERLEYRCYELGQCGSNNASSV